MRDERTLVVLTSDVDPRLPETVTGPPAWDVWATLDNLRQLREALGADLPPVTWMIRSDEAVKVATGSLESGYISRQAAWDHLVARGHELGWHFHHLSYREGKQHFDPDPSWLADAHGALSAHFPIAATRTGWDYANASTFRALSALGVQVDFSALPGQTVPWRVGSERFVVDWQGCPPMPYHPSAADHRRPGRDATDALPIVEVPAASFSRSLGSAALQLGWRAWHRVWSTEGVTRKTWLLTQEWPDVLDVESSVLVFFFHPEDLTPEGIRHFGVNLRKLQAWMDPEFVTARALLERLAGDDGE